VVAADRSSTRDPMAALNCLNGTQSTYTERNMHKHTQEDLLTKISPVRV
jgi:hypothetical protein